jgi:HK97 family phage major capsid protein
MPEITRQNVEALIREQVIEQVIEPGITSSFVLQHATQLPNMTGENMRMKVLDVLPMSYWVNGDNGMKQTTRAAWDNVWVDAAELAVIVPIAENVLADADYDIFGSILPRIQESFGYNIDRAIIFGDNVPSVWPLDIVTRARQAGNNVASGADLYNTILATNGLFDKVESVGYGVNAVLAAYNMKAKLRGVRTTDGAPIFMSSMQTSPQYSLDGAPMQFLDNGAFDNTVATMIAGDFSKIVYSIRSDVDVKIIDQGVIQDPNTGDIVYNLPQQDMIAIRVTFRLGWNLPNPVTMNDKDRVTCPFAYIEPATPVTTYTATFTVTEDETPIEGAVVNLDGARILTNASGVAVFNVRNGDYKYRITADGYKDNRGELTVNNGTAAAAVSLTLR